MSQQLAAPKPHEDIIIKAFKTAPFSKCWGDRANIIRKSEPRKHENSQNTDEAL